jgi:hypothetical protein
VIDFNKKNKEMKSESEFFFTTDERNYYQKRKHFLHDELQPGVSYIKVTTRVTLRKHEGCCCCCDEDNPIGDPIMEVRDLTTYVQVREGDILHELLDADTNEIRRGSTNEHWFQEWENASCSEGDYCPFRDTYVPLAFELFTS